jgi:hypothetical protein
VEAEAIFAEEGGQFGGRGQEGGMAGVKSFDVCGACGHLLLQRGRKRLVTFAEHIGGGHGPPCRPGHRLLERPQAVLAELAEGVLGLVVGQVPVQRHAGVVEDDARGAAEILVLGPRDGLAVDAADGLAFRRHICREVDEVGEMGDVRMVGGCLGGRGAAVGVGDDDHWAFHLSQVRGYLFSVVVHTGGGRALRAGAGQVDRAGLPAAGGEGVLQSGPVHGVVPGAVDEEEGRADCGGGHGGAPGGLTK